jgi:Predicted transcriptional regulators
MRTVKQVSDLTGISIRMLHYYDQIGLLKPSKVTDTGYRLYDNKDLMILQQIMFYKELDIPLKEVKKIMLSSNYDKTKALENQKKLLLLKCDRIKNMVELINKTLKGEIEMSFKEFDMSEYFNALEDFKKNYKDKIIKNYGGMDKYDELIEKCKLKEDEIAKMAIKQYGSIEKYVEAMKKNFESDMFTIAEQYDEFKKDILEDKHPVLKELYLRMATDLKKDPSSKEIQQIAEEIKNTAKRDYQLFNLDEENKYWYTMVQIYLILPDWIKLVDQKYGEGASKFIGEALKTNLQGAQPKINILYNNLTEDLKRDPASKDVQDIVEEIVKETTKQHEGLKVEVGDNYWGYTADMYLTNSAFQGAADKNYGEGAARFIGEALKHYAAHKE